MWQWLEQMRGLSHGSLVAISKHAVDENFASIVDKITLIQIDGVLADINTPEDIITGVSKLYIEKGINIEIHKLPF